MRPLTLTLLTALATGTVLAQTASPIALKLTMYAVRTVQVDGKTTEQLTANPGNVLPGDVVSQVVTVSNSGERAVTNLPVTLPVPKNTVYMAPEAGMGAARVEYSTDGKTFAAAPLTKTVTVTENGRSVTKVVEVKPSEYVSVRWTVPTLAARQSTKLGYRIQVK